MLTLFKTIPLCANVVLVVKAPAFSRSKPRTDSFVRKKILFTNHFRDSMHDVMAFCPF